MAIWNRSKEETKLIKIQRKLSKSVGVLDMNIDRLSCIYEDLNVLIDVKKNPGFNITPEITAFAKKIKDTRDSAQEIRNALLNKMKEASDNTKLECIKYTFSEIEESLKKIKM